MKKIFAEVFNINEEIISDSLIIKDLENWDSLNHMVLIEQIESKYKVTLSGEQIATMQTVGDLKKALLEKGVKI